MSNLESFSNNSTIHLDKLSQLLWNAHINGHSIPYSEGAWLKNIDESYMIQSKIEKLSNDQRAGWKVGATNKEIQGMLKINEPASAPILQSNYFESPTELIISTEHNPLVESEFSFHIKHDLQPRGKYYQLDEIIEAVDAVCPAIELVGSRFEGGLSNIGALRLISDMVGNIAFIAGDPTTEWTQLDLNNHQVSLYKNGILMTSGQGSNVIGGPLSVLQWTVNHLSKMNVPIIRGEIITTGTCTTPISVIAGDRIISDFGQLGMIELKILEENTIDK